MAEFAVNGVTDKKVYDGCFAPRRKERPNQDMFKTIADSIKRERALIELKEIEAIKKKPAEERTFEERVKLAAHNLDKTIAAINEINPVIYVA